MEASGVSVKCTCVVEQVGDSGQSLKRTVYKSAMLELGRNELEDVVLKLAHANGKLGPYTIREHAVHKRFVREGKAAIRLVTQRLHLLVSNCPPEQLGVFLKSMAVKLMARGRVQGGARRMLGDVSLQFDDISPLNEKDVAMARRNSGKQAPPSYCHGKENLTTPKRTDVRASTLKSTKRKLSDISSASEDTLQQPAKKPPLLTPSGPPLAAEQSKVLQLVRSGESVFFTGSAGTGKSFLLKRIINVMPPETTFATASTGAAACLIGGTTIHAFAGIRTGAGSLEQCISLASQERKAAQWRRCRCLVLDEISMIDADYFDKIEAVARAVRRSKAPFGGIQLVLCGDFLQLPPVSKPGETKKHCFQARCWRRCVTRSVELTEIYRQSDKQFIAVLQNIRIGRCPPAVSKLLTDTRSQEIEIRGIKATKLYTHTEDVEATNLKELALLGGASRIFTAQDSSEGVASSLDAMCPAPRCVELKVGAQVMLTKNLDVARGLVNGARGVVKSFEARGTGLPVVVFTNGVEQTVAVEKWSVRTGPGVVATRRQLPLKLAWAISIHKSQGMTLDCVEISLGRCFEAGQAYVALSRAKSLKSLRVKDFSSSCVHAHHEVLEFYRGLRRMRRNYIDDDRT